MQRWFLMDHPNLNKVQRDKKLDYEVMSEESTMSLPSARPTVRKKFTVTVADVEPREAVFLTGNLSELGGWSHENLVPLVPQGGAVWSNTVELPADTDVLFRYCVAVVLEEPRRVFVRRWEAHLHPRKLAAATIATEEQTFGDYDGACQVSKGWLTADTIVQFKFFSNALRLKNRIGSRALHLKVTPLVLSLNGEGGCGVGEDTSVSADSGEGADSSGAHVEVALLNTDSCAPRPQEQFGTAYAPSDIMLVNVRALAAESLAYLVDLYAPRPSGLEEVPAHVASAYVLPDTLRGSQGRLELALTCHVKQRPIGSVRLDYLVVHPMPEQLCDMSVSFAKHWSQTWTGLEVGHRGLGASFKTKEGNEIRENTIASLKRAAASGADLLEFDVQLSRDLVPVIYHDYYVCISMRRKKQVDHTDMLELPVKDLSLDQLQKLKVYHLVEGRSNETRFNDEELEEHQPFPTLELALSALDPHVGFNVELKWNMELGDGTFELSNPFDINTYVDKVLEVLLKHGGERRVVLSGFNPDICTMLRNKQNKYPVMFLTQGVTERYPRYRDERCASIPAAVRHALSSDILGVVVHTEDLLRDPSQVKLATDAGLVMFCWGDDNNDKETIKKLKEMGLHAVIYDKLDQFTTKQRKESIFLVEARESQKELLRAAGSGDVGSDAPPACAAPPDARLVDAHVRASFASASVATVPSAHFERAPKRGRQLAGDADEQPARYADEQPARDADEQPARDADEQLVRDADKELQHKASSSFLTALPAASLAPPSTPRPEPARPKRNRSDP